jgi:hypothetical protein
MNHRPSELRRPLRLADNIPRAESHAFQAVGIILQVVGTILRVVGNILRVVGNILRAVGTILRVVPTGHTLLPTRDPLHEHTDAILRHALTVLAVLYHTLLEQGLLSALDHGASCIGDPPLAGRDRELEPQHDVSAAVPQG